MKLERNQTIEKEYFRALCNPSIKGVAQFVADKLGISRNIVEKIVSKKSIAVRTDRIKSQMKKSKYTNIKERNRKIVKMFKEMKIKNTDLSNIDVGLELEEINWGTIENPEYLSHQRIIQIRYGK